MKKLSVESAAKHTLACEILQTLRGKGHEAYFVGGCVRDLLLGKTPKDFDIATDATPQQIQNEFKRIVPVGAKFGVLLVVERGIPFEVATFRRDEGYSDGRRPDAVCFTNAREDALRRDFTVNGLFYDPVNGKVLDWVGGQRDLKRRLIRAIGDPARRFEEDKLRMLRAVRFASTLGFKMEPATARAIRLQCERIVDVSPERIRDELAKMFTGPDPASALKLLDKTGLLKAVLPEVDRLKGVSQPKAFHPEGDVFKHTLLMLGRLRNPPLFLAFGCLLHDIGKPATFKRRRRIRFHLHDRVGARMADRLLTRLRFSNEHRQAIVACVDGHMRFKDVRKMRQSTLKKMLQRPTFEIELEQHRLDCLASHGDLANWRFLKRQLRGFTAKDIRPDPLISGHDLLRSGYKEGPLIGKILKAVEARQLEHKLTDKPSALDWVKRRYKITT